MYADCTPNLDPHCSAFNIGHCITNLVGGYLAATHSPTVVLSVGVIIWSIFTAATPLAAATRSLPVLLFTRGIMVRAGVSLRLSDSAGAAAAWVGQLSAHPVILNPSGFAMSCLQSG